MKAVRLVEAYVFRRAVCAIPTNSLNKTFATFRRSLKKDRYLESIQAHFLLLPSYRRFPNDEEFKREFAARDLYNFPRRSYWLRRLENYGRKERVPVDEYTIEHIMPQNENLSRQWREDLGPDWQRVHETKLHTLGNLTLTGYNSEYSDRPFIEKRDMEGGFKESPLRLNEGLAAIDVWNEAPFRTGPSASQTSRSGSGRHPISARRTRGVQAHDREGVLVLDRRSPASCARYATRALFEALRKELLALDPCVTEEFLKLYVAYKAETNFVDVVPQASRLRLSLNMQFHELHDPRGVAKDVTNFGRWGNGDVEVGLASLEDMPYVLGLVRQSFEKQMGNGESGE